MRRQARVLINTPEVELWPADLLPVRSNADARVLARARFVLRRKRDGRYLAAVLPEGMHPLIPGWTRESGIDAALDVIDGIDDARTTQIGAAHVLPLDQLVRRLELLGLDETYGARVGLSLVAEPGVLAFAGVDRYRRALWLTCRAARAWQLMRNEAQAQGVAMDAISGYRSHDYQLGIFERKLARGQSVEQILTVNAAPGYSEHHSGNALDIGAPGDSPAEESFENTTAFEWLTRNGRDFGFVMSYPRNNPHGIVYEPWHWYYDVD